MKSEMLYSLESTLVILSQCFYINDNDQFLEGKSINLMDIIRMVFLNSEQFNEIVTYALQMLNIIVFKLKKFNQLIWYYYSIVCFMVLGAPPQKPQHILGVPQKHLQLLECDALFEDHFNKSLSDYIGIFANYIQKGRNIFTTQTDFFNINFI